MIRRSLSLLVILLALPLLASGKSNAQEISISGNGAGANSEVVVNIENNTTVQQTNEASIQNNIAANAETGENSVSTNTGSEASIQTGSINTSTEINNENINTNILDNSCLGCEMNIDAQIINNGSDSVNDINTGIINSINVIQSNTAYIFNNALTNANTGENTARSNNGDVEIRTGDISAITKIENKNINYNEDPQGGNNSFAFSISGNGSNSQNFINFFYGGSMSVGGNNYAFIFNNAVHNLNTGGNVADRNNGSVYIATGNITSVIEINNKDINKNIADICCDPGKDNPPGNGGPNPPPSQPPVPPVVPQPQPSNGNGKNGDGDNGKGGEVLAAAVGEILPVTGNYLIFLATLFGILMFLTGVYLRLSSGISPPAKS